MKKSITISLYMYELLYDVRMKLNKLAESKKDGTNEYFVSRIQDAVDENTNVLLRSIGNAYASIRNELAEYITDENERKVNNTLIEETKAKEAEGLTYGTDGNVASSDESTQVDNTLKIVLLMPTNYNVATRTEIAAAAHQYIVNTAMFDWLQNISKQDAQDYLQLAQNSMQKILSALYKRLRPTRDHVPAATDPQDETIRYE